LQIDARQIQRHNLLRQTRADMALEIHELAIAAAGQNALQLVDIQIQNFRQARQFIACRDQLLRIGPHRIDRRAYRQRLAEAIGNHAAMGGQGNYAQVTGITLLLQEILVEHM